MPKTRYTHSLAKRRTAKSRYTSTTTVRRDALPSARELGITTTQRLALSRIRYAYARLAERLSLIDAKEAEVELRRIESEIARWFPQWVAAKQAEQARKVESIGVGDDVAELFAEMAS